MLKVDINTLDLKVKGLTLQPLMILFPVCLKRQSYV